LNFQILTLKLKIRKPGAPRPLIFRCRLLKLQILILKMQAWGELISLSCAMQSCMVDGGRPTGNGLQELLPNCPELHV